MSRARAYYSTLVCVVEIGCQLEDARHSKVVAGTEGDAWCGVEASAVLLHMYTRVLNVSVAHIRC